MIDVWCCLWGEKYHPGYVYALKEAVAQHLTTPHRFRCLSDRELPGIDTTIRRRDWPSWWGKLELFEIAQSPSIYFDLDVIVVGNIDYLVEFTGCEFAAPANWARSGHGGIQSSVMAWDGAWREPAERFDLDRHTAEHWGDQEFIWSIRGDDWTRIPGIASFKYHCIAQLQDWARVVVFHGLPNPHEAGGWTYQYTRTLRSIISDSMLDGFETALQNAGFAPSLPTTSDAPPISTSSVDLGMPRTNGSGTRASS